MSTEELFAGRYQCLSILGQGGVALVHKAREHSTGRIVALKVLQKKYVTESKIRRRFMREARAFARLKHPNIVQMHEYGESVDGVPFIALEFIDGKTLASFRDASISLADLADVIDDVMAALAYSHAHGVYHRDVKPENIVVLESSNMKRAKLLDFGFARLDDDEGDYSKSDAFGTPLYMAPEQISHAAPIGPGVDIYSLGIVLYELLSGGPPFTGAHGMAVALKHLTDPVPPLEPLPELVPPPELIPLILRALEKEPSLRPQSVGEMRHAFRQAMSLPPLVSENECADDPLTASFNSTAETEDFFTEHRLPTAATEGLPITTLNRRADAFEGLVGRQAERRWLLERAQELASGQNGRVLLLGAPHGMGRRQLLQWFCDRLVEDGRVRVLSLGHRRHSGDDQGGLRELVNELMGGTLSPDTAGRQLEALAQNWRSRDAQRAAQFELSQADLRQILQFIHPLTHGGPTHLTPETAPPAQTVYAALAELVALSSVSRSVVLTVGGLERTGGQTVRFLTELIRWTKALDLPILIVVSYVHIQDDTGLEAKVASLRRAARNILEERELQPFGHEAMRALLDQLAPLDTAVAEAVGQRTQGNPFHAKELIQLLWQSGELEEHAGRLTLSSMAHPNSWPNDLETTLMRRCQRSLSGAPDGAFVEEALRFASILGDAFEFDVLLTFLSRILGDETRCERAIDTLIEQGLFTEPRGVGRHRLHFLHPLLSAGSRRFLSHERLTELNLAAAHAFVACASVDQPGVAIRIADHFAAADQPGNASEYLLKAAVNARQGGDWWRALELLERAERAAQGHDPKLRAEIWLEIGAAELKLGLMDRTKHLAARVAQWSKEAQNPRMEARAMLLLGDVLRRSDGFKQAIQAYGRAGQLFSNVHELRGYARSLLGAGAAHQSLGDDDAALNIFARAAEAFGHLDDHPGQAQLHRAVGDIHIERQDFKAASRSFALAKGMAEKTGDTFGSTLALLREGDAHRGRGDMAQATRCYEDVLKVPAPTGALLQYRADALTHLGHYFRGQKDWESAYEHFAESADLYERREEPEKCLLSRTYAGHSALVRAEFHQAWTQFERLDPNEAGSHPIEKAWLRLMWSWAALQVGHDAVALQTLEATLLDEANHMLLDDDIAWAYGGIALALKASGNPNRARLCGQKAAMIYRALGAEERADKLLFRLSAARGPQ